MHTNVGTDGPLHAKRQKVSGISWDGMEGLKKASARSVAILAQCSKDVSMETLEQLAKPSGPLSPDEVYTLKKWSLIFSEFQKSEFERAAGRGDSSTSVVTQYSCDSTPSRVRRQLTKAIGDFKVRRAAQHTEHFLIERAFLFAGSEQLCLLTEPNAIADTKAWTHFACSRRSLPIAREYGATGPCHEHIVVDGQLHSLFIRLRRKLHEAIRIDLDAGPGLQKATLFGDGALHLTLVLRILCIASTTGTREDSTPFTMTHQ